MQSSGGSGAPPPPPPPADPPAPPPPSPPADEPPQAFGVEHSSKVWIAREVPPGTELLTFVRSDSDALNP
eukprot:3621293-Prymnesium_polylepis.1